MRIRVSDNKERVKIVREKLRENNNYCPCSIVKTEDTKCPCKEFRESEFGECNCGLYVKEQES